MVCTCLVSQLGLAEKGFSSLELTAIQELLQRHSSVFSQNDSDLERTHLTCHQIDTGGVRPIKMHPRRVPLHLQQEVTDHIKQMLENDIIRPSCSP